MYVYVIIFFVIMLGGGLLIKTWIVANEVEIQTSF